MKSNIFRIKASTIAFSILFMFISSVAQAYAVGLDGEWSNGQYCVSEECCEASQMIMNECIPLAGSPIHYYACVMDSGWAEICLTNEGADMIEKIFMLPSEHAWHATMILQNNCDCEDEDEDSDLSGQPVDLDPPAKKIPQDEIDTRGLNNDDELTVPSNGSDDPGFINFNPKSKEAGSHGKSVNPGFRFKRIIKK